MIIFKKIPNNSIDLIYTDPPFGITNQQWDKPLNFDMLFKQMWRILNPDHGVIVLYASCPFTYKLLQHDQPKYHYCWKKNTVTIFF